VMPDFNESDKIKCKLKQFYVIEIG